MTAIFRPPCANHGYYLFIIWLILDNGIFLRSYWLVDAYERHYVCNDIRNITSTSRTTDHKHEKHQLRIPIHIFPHMKACLVAENVNSLYGSHLSNWSHFPCEWRMRAIRLKSCNILCIQQAFVMHKNDMSRSWEGKRSSINDQHIWRAKLNILTDHKQQAENKHIWKVNP